MTTLNYHPQPRRARISPNLTATRYHAAWHLDTAQLVAAENCCPVCGSDAPRARAGLIQQAPDVYLLHCPACAASSASHLPSREVLDEYYRRYFDAEGPKTTMPRVDRFVQGLWRTMLAGELPPHVRILDFGGGDGTLGLAVARRLLAERADRTVAMTLVDYQTPAAAVLNARLTITHRHTLAEADGAFDIVVASAVLEHIPELRPVMRRLLEALAPGGSFYARTPWVAPLKRLMPSLDITFPGHVHDLGAAFWNRVPRTFAEPLAIVVSRPSLIETCWRRAPARTLAAWLMKLPARIELALLPSPRTPTWRLVGGWEVVLRRRSTRSPA